MTCHLTQGLKIEDVPKLGMLQIKVQTTIFPIPLLSDSALHSLGMNKSELWNPGSTFFAIK